MQPSVSTLNLDAVKERVNRALARYCNERYGAASQVGHGYAVLWKSLSTLLQAGGKRLRPYMLLSAYQAYAEDPAIERVLPAALSQELVHLAMRVHDDIIDRDTIRYGIKNITGQYLDYYSANSESDTEVRHLAESSAILAGDILLSDSYRLLAKSDIGEMQLAKALLLMSRSVFEVVGGELLDTESALIDDPLVTAHTIARYKTASYSFIGPLVIGATLAGAPKKELETLQHFAESLGVAYQLRDDLLGVFGNEDVTGKSTSTDIVEGKRTHLIEQFELLATPEQATTFMVAFHNPKASHAQIATARDLLIESGAKAAVEAEIEKLTGRVQNALEALTISEESRRTFEELVQICLVREL